MWKNICQFTEETEIHLVNVQQILFPRRMSQRKSSDLLTHIPKQPCGFSLQETELRTHYCCCCCCRVWGGRESQSGAGASVHPDKAVCAFKFYDPLFTAGASWQGARVHAALNNWDCKVNVRRIVKDGSPPTPSVQSAGCTPANLTPAESSSPCSFMVFQNIKTDVNVGSCLTRN